MSSYLCSNTLKLVFLDSKLKPKSERLTLIHKKKKVNPLRMVSLKMDLTILNLVLMSQI
jgi:hypothetical protein